MTVRERILTIRLSEKIRSQQEYAECHGIVIDERRKTTVRPAEPRDQSSEKRRE